MGENGAITAPSRSTGTLKPLNDNTTVNTTAAVGAIAESNACFERELQTTPSRYSGSDDPATKVAQRFRDILDTCLSNVRSPYHSLRSGHDQSMINEHSELKRKELLMRAILVSVDSPSFEHLGPTKKQDEIREIYRTVTGTQTNHATTEMLLGATLYNPAFDGVALASVMNTWSVIMISSRGALLWEAPILGWSLFTSLYVLIPSTVLATWGLITGAEKDWDSIKDPMHQALWYVEKCMPPRQETYSVWERVAGKDYEGLVPHTREATINHHEEHAVSLPPDTNCDNWLENVVTAMSLNKLSLPATIGRIEYIPITEDNLGKFKVFAQYCLPLNKYDLSPAEKDHLKRMIDEALNLPPHEDEHVLRQLRDQLAR